MRQTGVPQDRLFDAGIVILKNKSSARASERHDMGISKSKPANRYWTIVAIVIAIFSLDFDAARVESDQFQRGTSNRSTLSVRDVVAFQVKVGQF